MHAHSVRSTAAPRVAPLAAFLVFSLALAGCDADREAADEAAASGRVPAATGTAPADRAVPDGGALATAAWPLPVSGHAAQPDLVAAPDGTLLLAWIEPDGEGHALRFARHADGEWSAPRTIARGDDWFVNWADTPHIVQSADGALWAHWLRKSAAATYAYDVVLSRSADGGRTWSDPVRVNDDGTPTEHGFASLWPEGSDGIGVAWLDGRATAGTAAAGHGGHGGGADGGPQPMMTLRTLRYDADLRRHDETRLDASVCDCCQTDVARAAGGLVLAYRDRTAAEIRDIAVARHDGGRWLPPVPVHADGWKMPACPVNGPAVAARGDDVLVAWYTGVGGTPRLRVATSKDGGARFGPPRELAAGPGVLGRVDAALGPAAGWVAWLAEDADGQSLRLARLDADLDAVSGELEVARVAGRGRGTGMPQLALAGDTVHLAWTEVVDGAPRLRGATVSAGTADDPAGGPAPGALAR